ncbi:hypothetical protein BOTBODRAFT_97430, partial [Botryobasidium botryosum FD-172 SS1]
NRRHIPVPIKQQIISLSGKIDDKRTIVHLLDISLYTVYRVLRLAYRTGSVTCKPLQAGRPRVLNGV